MHAVKNDTQVYYWVTFIRPVFESSLYLMEYQKYKLNTVCLSNHNDACERVIDYKEKK